eukprot:CAMPEP_0172320838 /NCGR_PEP_ID=MMETSP1058-20130122/41582_1 /TAXON_ID=83371 /ORGANISM="Detonula confervacea, Strain CCMP 353" /LENGTH=37 /DNA_ID= /DNA_START= /DNA_END= /DNA_ORIENTATION=
MKVPDAPLGGTAMAGTTGGAMVEKAAGDRVAVAIGGA